MQNGKQPNNLAAHEQNNELSPTDLAKLFNYPSVGELFSGNDSQRFDEFCSKLTLTRESLDRIIRYGNRADAESASRAAKGIEVTLGFLQSLQKLRLDSQK